MKRMNVGFVLIIGLLLGSAVLSWSLYYKQYTQQDVLDVHTFPGTLGEWQSEEMTIAPEEYAILETRNAFARKYFTSDGAEVYLFIVYSESNRKVSHPPEVCYTGGGATVLSKSSEKVFDSNETEGITARKLILETGRFKQVVYYWFKVGNEFTANYWKQQMLIATKTLLGEPSNSALIRLSAIVKVSQENAEMNIKKFAEVLTPQLFQYLP